MSKELKSWPVFTSYKERNLLRVAMPLGGIGPGRYLSADVVTYAIGKS